MIAPTALPPCGAACIAHRLKADAVICELRRHVLVCRVVQVDGLRCSIVRERQSGRFSIHRAKCPPAVRAAGGGQALKD